MFAVGLAYFLFVAIDGIYTKIVVSMGVLGSEDIFSVFMDKTCT